VITESDIGHLPEPVKRYIRAGGYIGKPKVDEGEFIRFESHDRPYEVSPGIYEVKPYSSRLGDYHESGGNMTNNEKTSIQKEPYKKNRRSLSAGFNKS